MFPLKGQGAAPCNPNPLSEMCYCNPEQLTEFRFELAAEEVKSGRLDVNTGIAK